MFNEDTAAFLVDFGVIAQLGQRRAVVLLDISDASLLGDRVQSTSYIMTFRIKDFPELEHGDSVTIGTNQYSVITTSAVDDGVFHHANLQKT